MSLVELGKSLIADLEVILREAEHRRTKSGKESESAANRISWCTLSVESASAIRYISLKANIPLPENTQKLLLDSLKSAFRQSKISKQYSFGCVPSRPDVIESYKQASCQAAWLRIAVLGAKATIDEAISQATTGQIANKEGKPA